MKNEKIIFSTLFLFVFSSLLYSQKEEYSEPKLPVDISSKLITYTKVIEVNASKDSLFNKGLAWFNSFYKNPTGVIKEKDQANGKITGKHQIKILNPADKNGIQTMKAIIQYTVITQYKDNKSRIEITDINISSTSYTPVEKWLDKTSKEFTTKNYFYFEQINIQMLNVITNYENFIKKPNNIKKDNW